MFNLVNLVALIFIAAVFIGLSVFIRGGVQEVEVLRAHYQTNYCVDAAMQALIDTPDLQLDQSVAARVAIDPQKAFDAYMEVFLRAYNISVSADNKATIALEYMPVFAVAGHDGYYIAQRRSTVVNDSIYEFVFTPKLPYTYQQGDIYYALNMNNRLVYSITPEGNLRRTDMSGPLPDSQNIAEINRILGKAISSAIAEGNQDNPYWSSDFYLPQQIAQLGGSQPVKGPSIITMMQGLNLTTVRPIDTFTVGGARIESVRYLVAYRRGTNSIPYYCYHDIAPSGVTVVDTFTDMQSAALRGYYCDIRYMIGG